jgi:arginyl-tRNA synthetase
LQYLEIPKDSKMGDFSLPCFSLSKEFKKNPQEIAKELSSKLKEIKEFEKVEAVSGYLNIFLKNNFVANETITKILKEKEKYGSSKKGKNKKILLDFSSPNIAKPFGIGHLRSTIIGNSLSKIAEFNGYKPVKINYPGDWGTQFGKLIVSYKKFGNEAKLKENPIKYLLELYVKVNSEEYEEEARAEFKKLEEGNQESLKLWKKFKELSFKEFNRIYTQLGIEFDELSGESFYNSKLNSISSVLESKNLLKESDGAKIVDLSKYNLGIVLINKQDGASLYATRDLAAVIDRYQRYKFNKMIYEVGSEQNLHFKQIFKILELLGFDWAKNCVHVSHGLYLDSDGKRFATRKGKTVFMQEILDETIELAKQELLKREKLSEKELNDRASKIAISAILYGDLKNYRTNNIVFDVERFLSFEGNTGPYLLYTYARAKTLLLKSKQKRSKLDYSSLNDIEKKLILELTKFSSIVENSFEGYSPNLIANYAYEISQLFNEYYHQSKIIGSENEAEKVSIVLAFSIVLKSALSLLGIPVLERM